MKSVTLLTLLIFYLTAWSQQYTLPAELIKSYNITPAGASNDMIIETSIDEDGFYLTTLQYEGSEKEFKLKPFTYPSFELKLKQEIKKLIESVKHDGTNYYSATIPDEDILESFIPLVFTRFVTYYNSEEEKPKVADIYLKNTKVPVYVDLSENKNILGKSTKFVLAHELKDVSVEISFYAGFIEKIQVHGFIGDDSYPVTFNNKFSIGISSTKNIQSLGNNTLFSDEKFNKSSITAISSVSEVNKSDNKITAGDDQFENSKSSSLSINLGDVIRYVKKVDVNANDVSPVPQIVLLDENQKQSKLYKEESSKLFEAVVYTDFLGLFDEENPNGIVQTEINKRFNINTSRLDVEKKYALIPPLIVPILLSEGIGFFQYIDASFKYSKIEPNRKLVNPEQFNIFDAGGNLIDSTLYFTPISLFQRRVFSFGADVNIVSMENQNLKLNMYANVGFHFGRTGLQRNPEDSEGYFTNNVEVPIEFVFHILPEKRVSFSFSDRVSLFKTFDANINFNSIENNTLQNEKNWLNSFNLDMNINISSNGRLFLRYKLTHELGNINNNFSRLQLGSSFYLLKNNGVKKKLN